ncbi:MAG TPA: arginase family protein [Trueperaceae bacterium]|nr:arginase family protein [Trueperaceae bacterium]
MSDRARSGELSFTGPFTFFKARHVDLASWAAGQAVAAGATADSGTGTGPGTVATTAFDIGLLGIPYDFAIGFRAGSRWGPAAMRQASGRYAPPAAGFFDLASGRRRLSGVRLADLGDVDPAQLETETTFARVTQAARLARRAATLPVFIGGDHSLTYPLLRAYDDEREFHVLQFDAHLDFSDARNGTSFSNSSPFRRAREDVPGFAGLTVIGLRGLRFDQEAVTAATARGHTLVTADAVHESLTAVRASLPAGQRLYISLDVDAIDPAEVPGTSSPEPGGLGFRQVTTLLSQALADNDVIGFDVMELAPELDPSGRSQLLVARLLAEALAAWWDARH